jgi:hypothetical protein
MALAASALGSSLASSWLVAGGGSYPASPDESADRFAAAVSGWFAGATAGPYPCTTATARRAQLQGQAAAAIQAKDPALAAAQLALALMAYMTGQAFGPGVASPPTAVSAGQAAIGAVFADLNAGLSSRADQIAQGVFAMAVSTIVVFPPVISPPTPVT